MDSFVFGLILFSALLHATWNFVMRKQAGNLLVLWAGMSGVSLLLLPIGVYCAVQRGGAIIPNAAASIAVFASGFIHGMYYYVLSKGYRCGDLSLVYPVARGSGVAIAVGISFLVFQEDLTALGLSGIGTVVFGIMLMGGLLQAKLPAADMWYALLTGLAIASYSVIDAQGARLVQPVLFLASTDLLAGLLITPLVVKRHRGEILTTLADSWRAALLVGVGSIGGYLLVLYAFTLGTISYVVAARECSVVFGALLGVLVLKEQLSGSKAAGIALVITGMLILRAA